MTRLRNYGNNTIKIRRKKEQKLVIVRGSELGAWGIHKSRTKANNLQQRQIHSFKRKVTTL